jgi:hypothetical protein
MTKVRVGCPSGLEPIERHETGLQIWVRLERIVFIRFGSGMSLFLFLFPACDLSPGSIIIRKKGNEKGKRQKGRKDIDDQQAPYKVK